MKGGGRYQAGAQKLSACLTLAALALAGAAGCSSSPSADYLKALASDQANVCVRVTLPQGSLAVNRANCQNCSVTCGQDGSMTVSSPGTSQPTVVTPSGPNAIIMVPK